MRASQLAILELMHHAKNVTNRIYQTAANIRHAQRLKCPLPLPQDERHRMFAVCFGHMRYPTRHAVVPACLTETLKHLIASV